jgi:hypothetical protein
VGATLGAIGAQLPYPYVHLVYWTVQLLLAITAIQYGCDIGVDWYTKQNGEACIDRILSRSVKAHCATGQAQLLKFFSVVCCSIACSIRL